MSSPATGIDYELSLLYLKDDAKDRLRQLYRDPTPEAWSECYCFVLPSSGTDRRGAPTLWQALAIVNPGRTPSAMPGLRDDPDEWAWAPNSGHVKQALCFASH